MGRLEHAGFNGRMMMRSSWATAARVLGRQLAKRKDPPMNPNQEMDVPNTELDAVRAELSELRHRYAVASANVEMMAQIIKYLRSQNRQREARSLERRSEQVLFEHRVAAVREDAARAESP